MADQRRLERIADVEGMSRATNEEIVEQTYPAVDDREPILIRCECGDDACLAPFEVPHGVYERVREDPMLFLVRPGHEVPEAEDVVERTAGWEIVRKDERVRPIVEQSDPRH